MITTWKLPSSKLNHGLNNALGIYVHQKHYQVLPTHMVPICENLDLGPWTILHHHQHKKSSQIFCLIMPSKANLRELIAATGLAILLKIGFKSAIFLPVWPWNLMDDLKQGKSQGFDSCNWPSNLIQNWIQIVDFFAHVTLKFNRWSPKTL